jgi:deoxyribodipyrimidine photo-lyase
VSGAIVLFTRDLRVHDHPGLTAASAEYDAIIPLFVFDDALLRDAGRPNRLRFLLDALADLKRSLGRRGADLVVRRGDVVEQAALVARAAGAKTVFIGDAVSAYAQERTRKLQAELDVRVEDTTTAISPGELVPEARDHYRVFTPFWRRWQDEPLRPVLSAPRRLTVPSGIDTGRLPELHELARGKTSAGLPPGGEREARSRLERWLEDGLETYDAARGELAADRTSRLSAYLHFGCISPVETITRARRRGEAARAFVRQLCWRDFYSQLLAANPQTPREDLKLRRGAWNDDLEGLENWRRGTTGYPIVDAGMRQLHDEGWMHNRARLVVAAFLTRTLGIDWRHGARTFAELLVDADVANNVGNWQWVAGTGVDTRPNRAFNPIAQAMRCDPDGDYVRRYVPELAELAGSAVHEPWRAPLARVAPEYPPPMPCAA